MYTDLALIDKNFGILSWEHAPKVVLHFCTYQKMFLLYFFVYGVMVESFRVEVDEALARRFRRKAMELYGYRKGSLKKAFEVAMSKFVEPVRVDWKPLMGVLKQLSEKDSVAVQHTAWSDELDSHRH